MTGALEPETTVSASAARDTEPRAVPGEAIAGAAPAAGAPAATALEAAWVRARVERARRGDEEAFGELYHRFGRLVHGILLARTPPAEAQDLVQEVFLLAMRKLRSLRDPAAFGPWLATLARRAAADHHRSGPRRFERPAPGDAADPAVAPAVTAESLAILQALARLPEAYRETLLLRLVEGMSGREIAAATGLTEGSVRVNLSRGMARLRAALRGDDHG